MHEPPIRVGIVDRQDRVEVQIHGPVILSYPGYEELCNPEFYAIWEFFVDNNQLQLLRAGYPRLTSHRTIKLVPQDNNTRLTLFKVPIGKSFHWQQTRDLLLYGKLEFILTPDNKITVVNEIELERYITSVISSEMNSQAPEEYLKAHAVISRSWVLAQISPSSNSPILKSTYHFRTEDTDIAWWGIESHSEYDVCNDDHCQRYHGFEKISSEAVSAVKSTAGEVLVYEPSPFIGRGRKGEVKNVFTDENITHLDAGTLHVCDTRFSKVCGGRTEHYETVWQEDRDLPYLHGGIWDGDESAQKPITTESEVDGFIASLPPVYCNITDPELLHRILVDFDLSTTDFFRWQVRYKPKELTEIVNTKSGFDIGEIKSIVPLSRGISGRIKLLELRGTKKTVKIGKELNIRRVLAKTHLYSSLFTVSQENNGTWLFTGAGWGHGVGLCQFGAAQMSVLGKKYTEILTHYFPSTNLVRLY